MITEIHHIDQVVPRIVGRKDFIHVVKDGYQVIDYVYQEGDSFADPIRQQCRGLKFDSRGGIIGRPFHKFFNYGEKLLSYDWNSPHKIMLKLDGSMVSTTMIRDELRLCTRMGITEHSLEAEKYLTSEMKDIILDGHGKGWNFIFEYTAPDNRIVIEYDKPELTLLAIRDIVTGEYIDTSIVENRLKTAPVFQFKLGDENISNIRQNTTGIEGYVVAWQDGTYVKIKTEEYVQMHRAVSFFDREDMILPVVLDSQCDDLYPNLSLERSSRLFEYETSVMKEFINWVNIVKEEVSKDWESRKEFAIYVNSKYPRQINGAFFAGMDNKDIKDAVKRQIIKNPDILETRW